MNSTQIRPNRPPTGLPPEKALARWSDAEAYAAMIKLIDAANRMTSEPASVQRHFEYSRRRDALETTFVDRLKRGELYCSGIPTGGDDREIIRPALWSVLMIEYDFDEVGSKGRKYEAAEFFEPQAIPLNITEIPDWIKPYMSSQDKSKEFDCDSSYQHVELRGRTFVLGKIQAEVVRLLHEASSTTNPWMSGKPLLSLARSQQTKLGEVFKSQKDWKCLIESDGRGQYRLNLSQTEPTKAPD